MITILASKSRIETPAELTACYLKNGIKAEAVEDGEFVEITVYRDDDEGLAEHYAKKGGFQILD